MLLKQNFIVFVLLIASYLVVDALGHVDLSVGNLLFLPLGATLYAYLSFSKGVVASVILANTLVGYFFWGNWFGNGLDGFIGHVLIGSFAPLFAIYSVKSLKLDSPRQNYWQQLVLLSLLSAIFNTLGKFFSFMDTLIESIEPLTFLGSFMLGDILGCLVFIYVADRFLTPRLKRQGLQSSAH